MAAKNQTRAGRKPAAKVKSAAKTKAKLKVRRRRKAPPRVNLTELAELLEISLTTARALVREPGFPVAKRGRNGVPYEFDAAKVARWKAANEARLEAERQARAEELAQLKLELFGGVSADETRAHLSPRDQMVALQAEVHATNLARLRGELVPAAEVEAALAETFTNLRARILEVPDQVGRQFDLDRPARAGIQDQLEQALTAAQADMAAAAGNEDAAARDDAASPQLRLVEAAGATSTKSTSRAKAKAKPPAAGRRKTAGRGG